MTNEYPNWHDIEIFHAVLEHGSFSAAARALGMSQPTVSRHIEALERKLGKELFVRSAAGLGPSELALELADHTKSMSASMHGIRCTLDGKETLPEGIVTFSMPYSFGSTMVAEALEGFHLQFPGILIDLKSGPPQSNLGRREADIELRWSEPREPELITRSLGHYHFGVFATEKFLRNFGTPRELADLSELPMPYFDEPVMAIYLKKLEAAGVRPHRFPFRCSGNGQLSVFLALRGHTLVFAPPSYTPPDLIRLLPEFHFTSPPLWLAMHSALRRNAPIRAVWERLVERLPAVMQATREQAAQ